MRELASKRFTISLSSPPMSTGTDSVYRFLTENHLLITDEANGSQPVTPRGM